MRQRQYWLGLASLVRPLDLLGIGIFAAASVLWTGYENWGLAGLAGFTFGFMLIAAGGYAYNDACDVRIDRISHPNRPLITGAISRWEALVCAWATTLVGLICLAQIGRITLALGMFTAAFLFLYSWRLKDWSGLVANIALSACLALLPVDAALHGQVKPEIGPLFGTVFGLMLCREVVKDLQDRSGDALAGRRTLATDEREWLAVSTVLAGAVIAIASSLSFASEFPLGMIVLVLDLIVGGTVLGWLNRRLAIADLKHSLKFAMFGFAVVFLVMGMRQ